MNFMNELRQNVAAYGAKQIDMQSIQFQLGREIARAYVDMMKSYARLHALSGRYEQSGDQMVVTGFCRLEEEHFGQPLLERSRKQNFWTAQWTETSAVRKLDSNLYDAFSTSLTEFCEQEGIQIGPLTALVRDKAGALFQDQLPVTVTTPEYLEAIGFPYTITF